MNLNAIIEMFNDKIFPKQFSKNVDIQMYQSPSEMGVALATRTLINTREMLMLDKIDGEVVANAITKTKDALMETALFDDVKEDLKEYEKLKNMKFVLESLAKMDLQVIPKPTHDGLSQL